MRRLLVGSAIGPGRGAYGGGPHAVGLAACLVGDDAAGLEHRTGATDRGGRGKPGSAFCGGFSDVVEFGVEQRVSADARRSNETTVDDLSEHSRYRCSPASRGPLRPHGIPSVPASSHHSDSVSAIETVAQ
ncbi:hypothetical protein QNA28_10505 [Rhodococcus rhodochrous]|nr:hypothetical protein [Rhodococcus rhodochrous]MDJ0398850.1 hypothetical protein [Rhodococcus rhodochrous]